MSELGVVERGHNMAGSGRGFPRRIAVHDTTAVVASPSHQKKSTRVWSSPRLVSLPVYPCPFLAFALEMFCFRSQALVVFTSGCNGDIYLLQISFHSFFFLHHKSRDGFLGAGEHVFFFLCQCFPLLFTARVSSFLVLSKRRLGSIKWFTC